MTWMLTRCFLSCRWAFVSEAIGERMGFYKQNIRTAEYIVSNRDADRLELLTKDLAIKVAVPL